VQLGAERETKRPLSPHAALHADTPLPPGRGRVQPVVVPRAVDAAQAPGVTAADLPRLRARLAAGEVLPFASVGDGPNHGHCGLAYRADREPRELPAEVACVPRGTAMCMPR
jgi:hypothetical protein